MYQAFNPYTGEDLRSIVPSPFASLGLGMGEDNSTPTQVTTGGGASAIKHPMFAHWLSGHPEMASGLKEKRSEFVGNHPRVAHRIKRHRNHPTGMGTTTTQPNHPTWVQWLQAHPEKANLLKQWRAQFVTRHPSKAEFIQWLRGHQGGNPSGMGSFNNGVVVGDQTINTHGVPGPNSVTFPTQVGMAGLGNDGPTTDAGWLDNLGFSPSDIFSWGDSSVYNPPPTSTVGIVDNNGNVYNPSNPLNSWIPDSGGSGVDFTSLFGTVLNDANSIAKIVLTPGGSYTSIDPRTGAQVSYQGTGQPSSGIGTSLNSSWLLIGGAALVGFMIFSMSKK